MQEGLDLLRENLPLRRLLAHYRRLKKTQPDALWHDRQMKDEAPSQDPLVRLHGLLLAHGWLDARVDQAVYATPGVLRACYQITREGCAALAYLENTAGFEVDLEVSATAS